MKYYRVKREFDNVAKYKTFKSGRVMHTGDIYIGGELLTEKEFLRHKEKYLLPHSDEKMFDVVEIPKSRIYWSFGARFECRG